MNDALNDRRAIVDLARRDLLSIDLSALSAVGLTGSEAELKLDPFQSLREELAHTRVAAWRSIAEGARRLLGVANLLLGSLIATGLVILEPIKELKESVEILIGWAAVIRRSARDDD